MLFNRRMLLLLGAIMIINFILIGCSDSLSKQTDRSQQSAAEHSMGNEGEPAPRFQLTDLNGNEVELADYSGSKVYIKYWASWCSICLAGLAELDELAGQQPDFHVLSIVTPNAMGEKSADDFTAWFKTRSYEHLTVLLDEDGQWAKQFGVRGFPSSYYIGSDGILANYLPGHNSNEQIKEIFTTIY